MLVRTLIAVVVGLAILGVGIAFLRALSVGRGNPVSREDAEDVDDLDVYLVCRECGTEFRVTRLGETQVPRHCGEPMQVVRRPAAGVPPLSPN